MRLARNNGIAFKGSTTGCKGFVLSDSEAKNLIARDRIYADVVQPFIGGQDFNSSPKMTTDRWVINFRDWSYEKAAHYPVCLELLEERVKPYFDARTGQIHEKDYWKFSDKRLESYESIKNFERVLFHAFTSKHLAFGFVRADIVYSAPHVVVALQGYEHFAILQSSLHLLWVVEICSTMGTGIRYAPSDLLETFPFPPETLTDISEGAIAIAGKEYYEERSIFMEHHGIGLTDFYNLFHDPDEHDPDIVRIRNIHAAIDRQLCTQYSVDGPFEHQFVETKIGVRFLPSNQCKSSILSRLKELNGQYFQEESSQGLLSGHSKVKSSRKNSRKSGVAQDSFDFGNVSLVSGTTTPSSDASTAVIEYLRSHSGWHAKADVLAATGITDGQWNAAIADLISGGRVERQGDKRGARYRATDAGGGCAMMPQAWFEMAEIRRRKFASSAWIPLRAVQPICEEGKRGHPGFKEEFFGAGSLAVPVELKDRATKLGWSDVGISHEHRACVDDGRYIPTDVYEYSRGEQIGFSLVLEQRLNDAEQRVWHLHQDFVIALELMRDGDRWICPNEGYTEVARLHRHPDGRPFLMEAKAEFLLDYLCARGMGLLVTAYWSREEVVEDIAHIDWAENPKHEGTEGARWEGRTYEIHEGGMPFGAETAVFHVSRTDVDPSEDVPVFGFPTDDVTEGRSWAFKREERKLFVVEGEYWRDEWINPGKYSARVRGDDVPGSVFFITDAAGTRESKETLTKESRWLWFRAEVISALLEYRGGHLGWYTRDTGSVTCSPDYGVHFGVNSIGLANVYAKDIGLLPDWQQRVWAGFNVTPEGGVSEELLASQMRAQPADTTSPETALAQALARMDEVFLAIRGKSLFREHPYRNEVLSRIHRFRSTSEKGLFALAKDIARLTADSIDIAALQEIAAPPKSEKWGSLKSLEKVLATVCAPEEARRALTPLVGTYQLRLADAHLPGSELSEAMKLAGIDSSSPTLHQGQTLIANCAAAGAAISSLIEGLAKSTREESHGTK